MSWRAHPALLACASGMTLASGAAGCNQILGIDKPFEIVRDSPIDVATPSGPHYTYVVDQIFLPSSNAEANNHALDLDGDNVVDNGFGKVLATVQSQGDIAFQTDTAKAVATGTILLLVELQTPDFVAAPVAALWTHLGDPGTAQPPPCGVDPDCGQHLDGSGVFDLSRSSPFTRGVQGPISASVFEGGPGELTVQIALEVHAITIPLVGARTKIYTASNNSLDDIVLAGGIAQDTLYGDSSSRRSTRSSNPGSKSTARNQRTRTVVATRVPDAAI